MTTTTKTNTTSTDGFRTQRVWLPAAAHLVAAGDREELHGHLDALTVAPVLPSPRADLPLSLADVARLPHTVDHVDRLTLPSPARMSTGWELAHLHTLTGRTDHGRLVASYVATDVTGAGTVIAWQPLAEVMTGWPTTQTQRARRGHDFWPTEPLHHLYATEPIPAPDKVIRAHYFLGGCDWWIVEANPRTAEAFGYACLGDPTAAEWGYIDLAELEQVTAGWQIVERDLHWEPRPGADCTLPGM